LGDGTTEAKLQPVEIAFESPISKLFSGDHFSFAQDESGNLWAWGDNQFGQLGLGDKINQNTPVKLSIEEKVIQLAAGRGHVLALMGNGTLMAWGDNSKGQLARAIDATIGSDTPIPVWVEENKVLENVVAIAAGDFHSVALTETGNILAWGDGSKGQLGAKRESSLSSTPIVVSDENGSPVSLKVPRIVVSTDEVVIAEGGESKFTVRLSNAPESVIRIQYELEEKSKFVLSEDSRLEFDSTNWDVDQTVTVSVEKDEDNNNNQASLIIKAEGFIDQRVNLVEEDNYPPIRGPRVASLDQYLLILLLLLFIGCRATVPIVKFVGKTRRGI
jgi:hypothetical protein